MSSAQQFEFVEIDIKWNETHCASWFNLLLTEIAVGELEVFTEVVLTCDIFKNIQKFFS